MKLSSLINTVFFLSCVFLTHNRIYAQSVSSSNNKLEQKFEEGYIQGAVKGSLICQDENGNRVVCSGNEEESILGFATNIPYVTINKPEKPTDNKSEFFGIAGTVIKKGDYLAPGANGTVIKCKAINNSAYAIALEDANGSGQKFRVMVIGNLH